MEIVGRRISVLCINLVFFVAVLFDLAAAQMPGIDYVHFASTFWLLILVNQ